MNTKQRKYYYSQVMTNRVGGVGTISVRAKHQGTIKTSDTPKTQLISVRANKVMEKPRQDTGHTDDEHIEHTKNFQKKKKPFDETLNFSNYDNKMDNRGRERNEEKYENARDNFLNFVSGERRY
jgi:hypothetical protein